MMCIQRRDKQRSAGWGLRLACADRQSWLSAAAILVAALLLAPNVRAQEPAFQMSLSGRVTVTDNAPLRPEPAAVNDVIVEATPSLAVQLVGTRARLIGDIGLTAINYINGTGGDRVLPRIQLDGKLEAVERLLFVDARVTTAQVIENPLAGITGDSGSVNSFTTTTYSVSPYMDWHLSPRTRLLIRSDNTRTETSGAVSSVQGARSTREQVRFEFLPRPLGLQLEAEHSDARFSGQPRDTLTQKIGRVILIYTPSAELVLNARGGYEDNTISGASNADGNIHGGGFEWRPTSRTLVRGLGERRFFGTGWEGAFTHRMPWLAWDVRTTRELSTSVQTLLALTGGGNVAALLDAIMTTRYPDPVERARIVQDLIRRQGLPTSVGGPLTIYTQRAFISTGRSLTLGLVGTSSTVSFSAASLRVELALPEAVRVSPSEISESEQLTTALTWTRRLSSFTAFNLTGGRTYIRGLGEAAGEETRLRTIRASLTRQWSPRAEGVVGVSRRLSESAIDSNFDENLVFFGLTKRF